MVFPNFFITFVRHSFHTFHPCTSPSRERRHRPAPPTTRHHTPLMAHAASRAMHTRCTPQKAMHTRLSHALHLAKGYATCAALPHSTHALHTTPPQRAMPRTRPTRKNAAMLSLAAPSFLRRKIEPPQPKYYILQYYM